MQDPDRKRRRTVTVTRLIGYVVLIIGMFNEAFAFALLTNGLTMNFTLTLILINGLASIIAGFILVLHPWKEPKGLVL